MQVQVFYQIERNEYEKTILNMGNMTMIFQRETWKAVKFLDRPEYLAKNVLFNLKRQSGEWHSAQVHVTGYNVDDD